MSKMNRIDNIKETKKMTIDKSTFVNSHFFLIIKYLNNILFKNEEKRLFFDIVEFYLFYNLIIFEFYLSNFHIILSRCYQKKLIKNLVFLSFLVC